MTLSTVATIAGYKSHYTQDGKRTLCGREVSNGTSGIDMCKACEKSAAKITAAETVTPVEPTPDAPLSKVGDAPVVLTRRMCTDGEDVPAGAEHVYSYSADWTRGMAHGWFNLYRFDEDEAYGELGDGVKWYGVASFSGAAPDLFYAGGSMADALGALAGEHAEHARRVDQASISLAGVRVSTITHGDVLINFLPTTVEPTQDTTEHATREAAIRALNFFPVARELTAREDIMVTAYMRGETVADDALSSLDRAHVPAPARTRTTPAEDVPTVHGIEYPGYPSTLCGETVRGTSGILRVSVDPSDVTCAECVSGEAELAARDASDGPTDDEIHAEIVASVEPDMDPALHAAVRAAADAERGVLTLRLAPMAGGRVMASVGAYERPFMDNRAVRMQVAFWAHTKGFQPVKGRGFDWHRSGKLVEAPARLI